MILLISLFTLILISNSTSNRKNYINFIEITITINMIMNLTYGVYTFGFFMSQLFYFQNLAKELKKKIIENNSEDNLEDKSNFS